MTSRLKKILFRPYFTVLEVVIVSVLALLINDLLGWVMSS